MIIRRKEDKSLTVAMMDIDYFKKINDNYGHDGGDAVLRHFGGLFAEHFDGVVTARLGGEEFALIADGEGRLVRERCEVFRQCIEKTPATFNDMTIPFTVSIGVTQALGANLDATIKHADENLYQAKAAGRNRIIAQ